MAVLPATQPSTKHAPFSPQVLNCDKTYQPRATFATGSSAVMLAEQQIAHVFGVLAKADWITKVACLLLRILLPNGKLHDARADAERHEAVGSRSRCHSRETSWHIIAAWELDVVVVNSAERRHHCHPTMLNLSGAMVTRSSFIVFLREAHWVKKPTGAIAPIWLAGWKTDNGLGSSAAEVVALRRTRDPRWRTAPRPSCWMPSLPVRRSAATRPNAANISKRPLQSSLSRCLRCAGQSRRVTEVACLLHRIVLPDGSSMKPERA